MALSVLLVLSYLLVPAIIAVALYWVIRLAVRHALADAARARTPETALPGAPVPLPAVTEQGGAVALPPSEG